MMSREVEVSPGDAQHSSGRGHGGWLEGPGRGGRNDSQVESLREKNLRELDPESDAIAGQESATVTSDSGLDGREEDPGASAPR